MDEKTPSNPPPDAGQNPPAGAVPPQGQGIGKGKTVVVIDDDPTTLELVCSLLENVDFQVLSAGNGEEGWKRVTENKVDLVIVDAVMPGMDGFSFFKELKKNSKTQTIPVLVLSARKNMGDAFPVSGVDSFLPKPLENTKFIQEVVRLVKRTS